MQTRRPRWPPLAGPAVASLTSPTSPIPSSRGRRSPGPAPPREEGVAVSGLGCSAAPDAQDDGSRGSVAKMEMVNPMALIYKALFSSISTFEPPPARLCTHLLPLTLAVSGAVSLLSAYRECDLDVKRAWARRPRSPVPLPSPPCIAACLLRPRTAAS